VGFYAKRSVQREAFLSERHDKSFQWHRFPAFATSRITGWKLMLRFCYVMAFKKYQFQANPNLEYA
jgi:hypothetical protein